MPLAGCWRPSISVWHLRCWPRRSEFFQEIFHILPMILSISEADLVLTLLSLIDMALVGGLLVMVMISGYEISFRNWTWTRARKSSTGSARWIPAR